MTAAARYQRFRASATKPLLINARNKGLSIPARLEYRVCGLRRTVPRITAEDSQFLVIRCATQAEQMANTRCPAAPTT